MQKGRVSDRVAVKPLKSLLTTEIHGKEAMEVMVTDKEQTGPHQRREEEQVSLVYHKGGHRRVLSKSKADKKKIKGEEPSFSCGSSGGT